MRSKLTSSIFVSPTAQEKGYLASYFTAKTPLEAQAPLFGVANLQSFGRLFAFPTCCAGKEYGLLLYCILSHQHRQSWISRLVRFWTCLLCLTTLASQADGVSASNLASSYFSSKNLKNLLVLFLVFKTCGLMGDGGSSKQNGSLDNCCCCCCQQPKPQKTASQNRQSQRCCCMLCPCPSPPKSPPPQPPSNCCCLCLPCCCCCQEPAPPPQPLPPPPQLPRPNLDNECCCCCCPCCTCCSLHELCFTETAAIAAALSSQSVIAVLPNILLREFGWYPDGCFQSMNRNATNSIANSIGSKVKAIYDGKRDDKLPYRPAAWKLSNYSLDVQNLVWSISPSLSELLEQPEFPGLALFAPNILKSWLD
ncbi:unnamed protein product [Protopolystoma xenopodis]|uniref:Uncharacterized protein n=1 Tax=Protopolystoma xenopodis TaxID=117903 RepID=A0A3S5BIS4_9PLAT|nr:unnamed protein product [Protopolystoma xenopodis]